MTEHVRFLEQLPVRAVVDGELVAFGADGKPDFDSAPESLEQVVRGAVTTPLTTKQLHEALDPGEYFGNVDSL